MATYVDVIIALTPSAPSTIPQRFSDPSSIVNNTKSLFHPYLSRGQLAPCLSGYNIYCLYGLHLDTSIVYVAYHVLLPSYLRSFFLLQLYLELDTFHICMNNAITTPIRKYERLLKCNFFTDNM